MFKKCLLLVVLFIVLGFFAACKQEIDTGNGIKTAYVFDPLSIAGQGYSVTYNDGTRVYFNVIDRDHLYYYEEKNGDVKYNDNFSFDPSFDVINKVLTIYVKDNDNKVIATFSSPVGDGNLSEVIHNGYTAEAVEERPDTTLKSIYYKGYSVTGANGSKAFFSILDDNTVEYYETTSSSESDTSSPNKSGTYSYSYIYNPINGKVTIYIKDGNDIIATYEGTLNNGGLTKVTNTAWGSSASDTGSKESEEIKSDASSYYNKGYTIDNSYVEILNEDKVYYYGSNGTYDGSYDYESVYNPITEETTIYIKDGDTVIGSYVLKEDTISGKGSSSESGSVNKGLSSSNYNQEYSISSNEGSSYFIIKDDKTIEYYDSTGASGTSYIYNPITNKLIIIDSEGNNVASYTTTIDESGNIKDISNDAWSNSTKTESSFNINNFYNMEYTLSDGTTNTYFYIVDAESIVYYDSNTTEATYSYSYKYNTVTNCLSLTVNGKTYTAEYTDEGLKWTDEKQETKPTIDSKKEYVLKGGENNTYLLIVSESTLTYSDSLYYRDIEYEYTYKYNPFTKIITITFTKDDAPITYKAEVNGNTFSKITNTAWESTELDRTYELVEKSELNRILSDKATNSPETPYKIKIIGTEGTIEGINTSNASSCIDGSIQYALINNGTKCVDILLSSELTTIDNYAFSYCNNLVSITIPDSVTSIGNYAFKQCWQHLVSIAIPDTVVSIGKGAFSGCKVLSSIKLSDSVKRLDEYVLDNCDILSTVILPKNLETINQGAFNFCQGLERIEIPSSVTSIGTWAFSYCTTLTEVIIPKSVTSFGSDIFAYCKKLTSVTYEGTMEEFNTIENYINITNYVNVICTNGTIAKTN